MSTTETVPQPFPKWTKPTEQKTELMKNFESCTTVEDLLTFLKDLEPICQDPKTDTDLALVYANLALKLYDQVNSDIDKPELLLSFSNKASLILTPFENYFQEHAFKPKNFQLFVIVLRNLWLCGVACRKLNRNEECLDYLTRASKIGDASFSDLDKDENPEIFNVLAVVENEIATCNKRLGMPDEKILPFFRKGTDIQEMFADEYDDELGKSFMNLSTGYVRIRDFKQALPYCLKAVKIFMRNYGEESMEVIEARRFLGTIYGSLGDNEKALEELRVSMGFLKMAKPGSKELVEEEIRVGTYLVSEGKYKEAIATLEAVGLDGIEDKGLRGMAFLNMAQAHCRLGNLVEARRCAEKCGSNFDKKVDQVAFAGYVAHILLDLAELYEEMNDLGNGMLCLERLLTMSEKLPLHLLTMVTAKYNRWVSLTGKEETGLRYLKVAARKLKESYGSNHVQVGIAYSYLGQAYLELKKPLAAAEIYKEAKEIMDATLGPYHENSVKVCQGLLLAYKNMGSHSEATRIQEMVNERLKGSGQITREEMEKAVREASMKPFNL